MLRANATKKKRSGEADSTHLKVSGHRKTSVLQKGQGMSVQYLCRISLGLCAILSLSACQEGAEFPFLQAKPDQGGAQSARPGALVERDVEAPEIFQVTENGLWDGRPSLGGVWVAYPGVTDPERVIIRNQVNGNFVIGALFNRERDNPGPKLQISSDAASALAVLAGQPTMLNVTALRKEEVPVEPEVPAETVALAAPESVETQPLDAATVTSEPVAELPAAEPGGAAIGSGATPGSSLDALAAAEAAIAAAEKDEKTLGAITSAAPPPAPRQATAAAAPAAPKPAPVTSGLAKPFIQVGIFSVQANAIQTGDALRLAGIVPTILEGQSSGKTFWRVVVGPSRTSNERSTLMKKVKAAGYSDAYFVTN